MSIAKGNLILPIVNLDHSERNFVFCLAGFKNDLTSSVFMQPFGKAGVALNTCYSLPFPSCKLLLPNILWFFVFPFEPYPYLIVFVVFATDILAYV